MKSALEVLLVGMTALAIFAATVVGLLIGYSLAGVVWGAFILLVTNILLPLCGVHYELTLFQGFVGGVIIGLGRTVLSGLNK